MSAPIADTWINRAPAFAAVRHDTGAVGVHGREALPPPFEQDPHQVDDDMAAARRRLDRFRVAQIGLHGVDLSDAPERLEVARQVRTADGDPNPIAVPGQPANHMAAEEPGAAENRDEGVLVVLDHLPPRW